MHKTNTGKSIAITKASDPTPRLNLSSVDDVRREMARVYRDARGGNLPSSEATRLVYILSQMLKAYELYVLEERVATVEQKFNGNLKRC